MFSWLLPPWVCPETQQWRHLCSERGYFKKKLWATSCTERRPRPFIPSASCQVSPYYYTGMWLAPTTAQLSYLAAPNCTVMCLGPVSRRYWMGGEVLVREVLGHAPLEKFWKLTLLCWFHMVPHGVLYTLCHGILLCLKVSHGVTWCLTV